MSNFFHEASSDGFEESARHPREAGKVMRRTKDDEKQGTKKTKGRQREAGAGRIWGGSKEESVMLEDRRSWSLPCRCSLLRLTLVPVRLPMQSHQVEQLG